MRILKRRTFDHISYKITIRIVKLPSAFIGGWKYVAERLLNGEMQQSFTAYEKGVAEEHYLKWGHFEELVALRHKREEGC